MKIFSIKFTAFFLATLTCYILQVDYGFSPVLAAAAIGFCGSFIHFSRWVEKSGIHAVIYAGSFAGMCSPKYLSSPSSILIISLFGSCIYLVSKSHFKGFGGKLGTIAFLSSLFLIGLRQIW